MDRCRLDVFVPRARRRASVAVGLLLASSSATAQGPIDVTTPVAAFGRSVRTTLALHPARDRVYVDEGAAVAILRRTRARREGWAPIRNAADTPLRIPIDASVEALAVDVRDPQDPDDDVLLVAGGDFGLLTVAIGAREEVVPAAACALAREAFQTAVRDDATADGTGDNDKLCIDVALVDANGSTRVAAAFAAAGSSELRLYDRDTFQRVGVVALPEDGTAYGLAVDGPHVYVAMGTAGLVRVDALSEELEVERGPTLPTARFGRPHGFAPTGHGWPFREVPSAVVDVAVGEVRGRRFLYAACDDWGLGELQLGAGHRFGPESPLVALRPSTPEAPDFGYVRRVATAAGQDELFVACSSLDQSAWVMHTNFRYDLVLENQVGHMRRGPEVAEATHLDVFRRTADGPMQRVGSSRAERHAGEGAGWLELEERNGLLVLHTMEGPHTLAPSMQYRVRTFRRNARHPARNLGIAGIYDGTHKYTTGGVFSLTNPDVLVLGGERYLDARAVGALHLARHEGLGCLAPIAGTEDSKRYGLGIMPKAAQWRSATEGTEWLFHGGGEGFRLKRVRGSEPSRAAAFTLRVPTPPANGVDDAVSARAGQWSTASCFDDTAAGGPLDFVFAASQQTGEGIRVYSKTGLERVAERVGACSDLEWPLGCPRTKLRNYPCRLYRTADAESCWAHAPLDFAVGGATVDDTRDPLDERGAGVALFGLNPHPELAYPLHSGETMDPELDFLERELPLTPARVNARLRTYAPVLYSSQPESASPLERSWTLAVPAGFNVRELDVSGAPNPDYKRALVALYDFTPAVRSGGEAMPAREPTSYVHAPEGPGCSLNLDVVTVAAPASDAASRRSFAFVADMGGRLWIFDVTDVSLPYCYGEWDPGPSVFDGHYDNVTDVALDLETPALLRAYVGVHHRGVVRLTYEVDRHGELALIEEISGSTPGRGVTGVTLWRSRDGREKRLLVGDRTTRVYANAGWSSAAEHAGR